MNAGLDDVVVAETKLSRVDGERGELLISGTDLACFSQKSFEEVALALGTSSQAASYGRERCQAFSKLSHLSGEFERRKPMEALCLGLSALPAQSSSQEIIASFPVILALCHRGQNALEPRPELGQVEDFLRMFQGKSPSAEQIKALSIYLATVAEHGMNASTFTCRVVASTEASRLAATLAALGALSGPLHGGAPGPVLDLLDELDGAADRREILKSKVLNGEKLMGFGHRIYRSRDPRAEVLQRAVSQLTRSERLEKAIQVEALAQDVLAELKPLRALKTNVEFYTAVLLHELGFERHWFTALFATGRVLGWMAHYTEQRETGRLIRPKSTYVGAVPAEYPSEDPTEVSNAEVSLA